ncbi:MAG: hypothetical protein ACT4P7_07485 [Gemmatimonadaceae bacterium]
MPDRLEVTTAGTGRSGLRIAKGPEVAIEAKGMVVHRQSGSGVWSTASVVDSGMARRS